MATDRLSLATALEAAKIDRPAAERIATEIYDAIHNNVATKCGTPWDRFRTGREVPYLRQVPHGGSA
jgi:hypothetical protein